MTQYQLETILENGTFFESPRWHDGSWWLSDFYSHRVIRLDSNNAPEVMLEVPGQPSGIGWLPDGSMLVVSMKDHLLLRSTAKGTSSVHADLSQYSGGPSNDMAIDAKGHAYVGNFGFDFMNGADPKSTSIVMVDMDGTSQVVASEMYFPNGSVITPDGKTLIVGETMGCRYSAFDIEDDGTLSNRRTWAELAPLPTLGTFGETIGQVTIAPDGCSLDAQGQIWAADALANRVIRIAPGGQITDEIPAPSGMGFFACMLGGEDGKTLLLCSAPDSFEHLRKNKTEAVIMTTRVEVPHAGRP
ncbi:MULTISPECIES: SMP-30/gluconolactonase/LRE family protein [Acidithrix]|uniref:Virginiamycin B lyase n=2 Tax=root TaxID=1 RepID=A0A0D8HLB3_9ACTN|nr:MULTISPECIES: SMP-30/gluconolactonase/LRE family protein [Acidithrix]KJF18805.1 virginiamycin B lyase [Acidithrix ferrooxidans]CAG4912633.1 unnamed protein product [Acidithrix sp. C25]